MVHQNNTNTVTHSSSFSSSLTMAASSLFRVIQRGSTVIKSSYAATSVLVSPRLVGRGQLYSICSPFEKQSFWLGLRELSYGKVNLVIRDGKTKFETHEVEPPRKDKWKTKKRLKMQRKREKEKRKAANRRDPRRLGVKGKKKKQKFASPEERIKFKIDNARVKEALLIERLKRYEVAKAHGPDVKPDGLTGEERFYLKKMAQKSSNYLQVGRRGLFGGVILNMHMHWKKHETVKCICKPCKPGQVHEYVQELARLSGGIPIHIIGDDTIIFYRGKNYIQPEVMSPVDTLSKKKALEKSKYEQSLESVRRFIAIAEKELELYHRHVALYGDPSNRNPLSILDGPSGSSNEKRNHDGKNLESSNYYLSETEADSSQTELSESEDNFENGNLSMGESDSEEEEDGMLGSDDDDEEREVHFTKMNGQSVVCSTTGSSSISKHTHHLKSCIE